MSFDGELNLVAYDDVESLDGYASDMELDAYRNERLGKYAAHVEFMRRLDVPNGLRVVDIGSGSSAFLYALDKAGLLARGVGIELSQTRHTFAERWRIDAGFEHVTNLVGNFAEIELADDSFDVFTVIDDTYLYLSPENEVYPELLFATALKSLAPGGRLLLMFRNEALVAEELASGTRSFWVELPSSNAFKYALYRQEISPERTALRNESIYITRELTEKRKVEITEICDVGQLVDSLHAAGFSAVEAYEDLALHRFDPGRSASAVVVAER